MNIIILEAIAFASALSLDAFIASFAYGSKKIKIPIKSIQVINFICCVFTGISLLAGTIIKQFLPDGLTVVISFTILFLLGIIKLIDSITKSIIKKYSNINKEIKFSAFNFKFILNLYANPEEADIDGSKILSPSESASLAIALSLDSITVGIGAAIGEINAPAILICSFIINMLALLSGSFIGNKLAKKIRFDFSWLSGIILIILAFLKLV